MTKAERHREIVELVVKKGEVTTAELCERFHVSEMTVRRDLQVLAKEGVLRRVFGGAVSSLGRSYEPPWHIRSSRNLELKKMIGQRAAELICDGDSIAFDVGTTTIEIVRALRDKQNLTIVTSSLPIANEIVSKFSVGSEIRLILTGGVIRPTELSMTGSIPQDVYSELHVDKAFVGIGGVNIEDGLTEYNLEDALVKKALIASAGKVIVVADGSKVGRTTFAAVSPLSCVDTVITDSTAPPELVSELRQREIDVIIADQIQQNIKANEMTGVTRNDEVLSE